MKTVMVETGKTAIETKVFPETEQECRKQISCDNCIMQEFIVNKQCAHRLMLKKYLNPDFLKIVWKDYEKVKDLKAMKHIIISQSKVNITKLLPETHNECKNMYCSKCIMEQYAKRGECQYYEMLKNCTPVSK